MSGFVENLCGFLTECRNDIFEVVNENKSYSELKSKCLELSGRLLVSVPAEYKSRLIDLLDDLTAINSIETKYCYLCGLRDSNKPDAQFNPTAEAVTDELAVHKQYAQLKLTAAAGFRGMREILNAENCAMLDEYKAKKDIMLGIEKTYCYPGGLRDKKRFDNQFDSASKEWRELLEIFF